MRTFEYTITEEVGFHARPAGLLSKKAGEYQSVITIAKADGRSAKVISLFKMMALCIKCGDTVTVTIEGPDEDIAAAGMEEYFRQNL